MHSVIHLPGVTVPPQGRAADLMLMLGVVQSPREGVSRATWIAHGLMRHCYRGRMSHARDGASYRITLSCVRHHSPVTVSHPRWNPIFSYISNPAAEGATDRPPQTQSPSSSAWSGQPGNAPRTGRSGRRMSCLARVLETRPLSFQRPGQAGRQLNAPSADKQNAARNMRHCYRGRMSHATQGYPI